MSIKIDTYANNVACNYTCKSFCLLYKNISNSLGKL